jgi:hypothetical protein
MRRGFTMALLALALINVSAWHTVSAGRAQPTNKKDTKAGPMLSHDVYFTLKDNSPQAKKKLVEACKKYLTGHDGEVFFAAGPLADSLKREVNDLQFDVALHIVFKDIAAHDKYQDAKRHQQFIDENKDNWKKVRVFDSIVER